MIRTTATIVKLLNAPALCRLVPSGAVVLRCNVPCLCYPSVQSQSGWSYRMKNETVPPKKTETQPKNEVHQL